MKWFDSTVAFLFPAMLVEGTPWKSMWDDKERESFLNVARLYFPLVAVGYAGHFFLFDIPMGLEPIESWFKFRCLMVALAVGCYLYYRSSLGQKEHYKIPAMVMGAIMAYSQAQVTILYSLDAWMFCFIFILLTVAVLRMTALKSFIYALFVSLMVVPPLLEASLPVLYASSGLFVTLIVAVVIRTSYLSEVNNFLLNQENISAQKKIIELNIEFADRIRAFIPKVIAERLENFVGDGKMSVLEASVEVLRARKQEVACLFSDIRGYTQGSKDLDNFIHESVIPEVKVCSDAVEDHGGIPRKVGDLIFAYFDDGDLRKSVLAATMAGMEIARKNEDMNATAAQVNIKRYILVSCGEAIVGNLGGLDSSIEITALGSPVNFLSRLDDLTKERQMAEYLKPGDLLLCERSAETLTNFSRVELNPIEIHSLGLTIRDFPEVRRVFLLKPTDANYVALAESIEEPRRVKSIVESRGFSIPERSRS